MFLIERRPFTQFRALFRRIGGQIQLIPEGAGQCRRHACLRVRDVAGDVIGHSGIVRAHRAGRIKQRCTVLNCQAGKGIGVVARPDLRAVIKHTAVKPCAAARTVFKQQVGVAVNQALLDVIQSQHIAVVHFTLTGRGQCGAVYIGQRAVHVPFKIADWAGIQQRRQLLPNSFPHIGSGKVQRVLVTDGQRGAAGDLKCPVRVCAEQVTVRADGFRFHPDAEIQLQIVNFSAQFVHTAGQFGGVSRPVTKGGRIIIAAFEPAVIQHKEVHAALLGGAGKREEFFLIKGKIARLPAVDKDWTFERHIAVFSANQVFADGRVEAAAHAAEARIAVHECGFRRGEGFAGCKGPGKMVRFNAGGKPHPGIALLGLDAEIAAVHQRHTPALAGGFGCIRSAEQCGGIVEMIRDAAHTAHALHTGAQRGAVRRTFIRPIPVQSQEVKIFARQVKRKGRYPAQCERCRAGVLDDGRAGNQVAVRNHAVQKLHGQARGIGQRDDEGFPLRVLRPEGRQTGQRIFAGADLRALKTEVRGHRSVRELRLKERGTVVAKAGSGPFLRQQVGPASGVIVRRQDGGRRIGARAIVEMQEVSPLIHGHLVGCVGRMQGEKVPAGFTDNHGSVSFC